MSADLSVQQSLFNESERMDLKERETRIRKEAFRIVFDFMDTHSPIENTPEYWEKTCSDASFIGEQHITNKLCIELMGAALTYMGDVCERGENNVK